jgi:hypothetical protein
MYIRVMSPMFRIPRAVWMSQSVGDIQRGCLGQRRKSLFYFSRGQRVPAIVTYELQHSGWLVPRQLVRHPMMIGSHGLGLPEYLTEPVDVFVKSNIHAIPIGSCTVTE